MRMWRRRLCDSDSALFAYGQIVIIIVLEGEGRTPPRAVEPYSRKKLNCVLGIPKRSVGGV